MNTLLLVHLVVYLIGYPNLPGVVLGVFETEAECTLAASAYELTNAFGHTLPNSKVGWACATQT